MANSNLSDAKKARIIEFYTLYHYIEKEVAAYLEYDPDAFKNKVVLLPCDDPEWSNFTKYFALNFQRLKLKKLISTSYAAKSKKYKFNYIPTLFERSNPQFDKNKTKSRGKIFTLEKDRTNDGKINVDDLDWHYLEGDGDFRGEEVNNLCKKADIIITNPPFSSLWREFFTWINQAKKQFLIIGNINAITYREVFRQIKTNKVWLGATNFNTGMYFEVPKNFEYDDSYKFERVQDGKKVTRVPGVCWFTNLDHGRRHQPLPLMTRRDNIKFSKHEEIKGRDYRKYENFNAIDVPFTDAIPSDCKGVMGVPISFLNKYNPDQIKILGLGISNSGLEAGVKPYKPKHKIYRKEVQKRGAVDGDLYYIVKGKVEVPYARVLIKHKTK